MGFFVIKTNWSTVSAPVVPFFLPFFFNSSFFQWPDEGKYHKRGIKRSTKQMRKFAILLFLAEADPSAAIVDRPSRIHGDGDAV